MPTMKQLEGNNPVVYLNTTDAAEVERAAAEGWTLENSVDLFGEPKTVTTASPDLHMRRIHSGGCGNQGRWVLVGVTPRGRALARRGRVARLIRDGIPAEVAEAAASMQWGMEVPVARLASAVLDAVAAGEERPGSRWAWERRFGALPAGESMPRAWAAWGIAAAVVRGGAR